MQKHILNICLLLQLFCFQTAHGAPFAYISNANTNNVSMIDMASNRVTATIPVGVHPQGLDVNAAGTRAYVANWNSNDVSVIDTGSSTEVTKVTVGTSPMRVAVHPSGEKVYVSNNDSGTVSVIDAATNTVIKTLAVGAEPRGLRVNPAGTELYVANFSSDNISVIDTTTDTVTKTIPITGDSPIDLAITPDGSKIYVINYYSHNVSVIDTASETETGNKIDVGQNPIGVWVNPAGTKVFVTNVSSGNVMVIDPSTNGITAAVIGFNAPVSIQGSPDGSRLYVVEQENNRVSVLNSADYSVVTRVPVGSGPRSYNGNFIAAPPAVTEGLVALWRGEGNAFDVIGGSHGAAENGAGYATGKEGQAFSLDGGNDCVAVPNGIVPATQRYFTIAAWVYADSVRTNSENHIFYSSPTVGGEFFFGNRNGNFELDLYIGDSWYRIGTPAKTGRWIHLVGVRRGTQSEIWVNGVMVNSMIVPDGDLVTGRSGFSSNIGSYNKIDKYWDGLIDDLAIYNRALSAKEILRMYDPNGPVSWWKGENNTDDSSGDNDGTWQGTPTYGPGMSGNSFALNGADNYVQITPQSTSLDISSGHSFNLWIKLDEYPTAAAYILNKWVSGIEDKLLVVLPDGSVAYYLHDAFGGSGVVSSTKIELGKWYHLAATYDGADARLYVNGILDATKSAPGVVSNGNGTLYLGFNPERSVSEPHNHLKGSVDEIRWYKRSLSAAEVANSYGLVSLWKAEDNAFDAQGINNASLVDTPAFQSGYSGQAFSFNGTSQYAVVTAPVNLPVGNEPRTVAGWIKSSGPTNGPSGPGYQTMLGYGTPWTNGATFLLEWGGSSTNDRRLYLTGWNSDLAGSTQLNYDQWYHVAATYDGTMVRLYVNGVLDGSAARTLNTTVNSAGLMIGNSPPNDGWHGYFNGIIDEVVVFNRALTGDEILGVMESASDTIPDPFNFTDQTDVPLAATIFSNPVTVTGINSPTPISIVNGEYELNGNGTWTESEGTMNPGDSVRIRLTSSGAYSTPTIATLTIGGVERTFSVTTKADDDKPVVTGFSLADEVSTTMSVSVATFTATDITGVSGFMVTSSATPPLSGAPGWSATPLPMSITLSTAGNNTIYAWAKDPAGNVSDSMTESVLFKPVRRDPSPYTYHESISTACSAASSGETISTLAVNVPGDVTITGKTITIRGGHADGYESQPGVTTIQGTLTIGNGSLTVDRLAIR